MKNQMKDKIIESLVKTYKEHLDCKDEIIKAIELSAFFIKDCLGIRFTKKEKVEMYDEILYRLGE